MPPITYFIETQSEINVKHSSNTDEHYVRVPFISNVSLVSSPGEISVVLDEYEKTGVIRRNFSESLPSLAERAGCTVEEIRAAALGDVLRKENAVIIPRLKVSGDALLALAPEDAEPNEEARHGPPSDDSPGEDSSLRGDAPEQFAFIPTGQEISL